MIFIAKTTKGILISFPGYPYTPSSLLPDNGLANLAGVLLDKGHEVKIWDYGTVDMVRSLSVDSPHMSEVKEINSLILEEIKKGRKINEELLSKARRLQTTTEAINLEKIAEFSKNVVREIERYGPDYIGLKLWNGDGFVGSLMIASEIKKKRLPIKVFAGGPHVDWFGSNILDEVKDSTIDALVYGEGEEIIADLADYSNGRKRIETISNLFFKENGKVIQTPPKRSKNLDNLPFPIYSPDIYPAMLGDQKIKIIIFDESRGCPFSCNFCIHEKKSGKEWRTKWVDKAVKELTQLSKKHNTQAFVYAGSSTPYRYAEKVAKSLLSEGISISYSLFGNINDYARADFNLLKASGCESIFFGAESGSARILHDVMNKRLTSDRIRQTLVKSKEAGIFTVASFIFPAPSETPESRKETLDLILNARPDSALVQFPGLIPNSKWMRNYSSFGFDIYSENFNRTLMNYKIKLLYPSILWDKLPYSVDGKDFGSVLGETENMVVSIEKNGILTGVPHDMFLISKYAGIKPREFRDLSRGDFYLGNWKEISDMVKTVNSRLVLSERRLI